MTEDRIIECSQCKASYDKDVFNNTFLGLCPSCLTKDTVSIPKQFGQLELLEPIGQGGMGIVYRGRHVKLGRTVAIKILSSEASIDAEFLQRFEREAKTLALLNHPNIVAIYDYGQQDGFSYLAMEYIDGISLEEKSKSNKIDKKEAIEIAFQVCDALIEAHKVGIIHRDIKPANILIDKNNRVKVADFGIAAIMNSDTLSPKLTLTGYTVGTPMYGAPEQLAGIARQDVRIDIYSLGVVLYEMLTGELPVGSWVSAGHDIDPILKKALARKPEYRYQSVEELKKDLINLRFKTSTVQLQHSEENIWIYSEAFLCTVAASTFFWTLTETLTPKIFKKGEFLPNSGLFRDIGDGKFFSPMRFELLPTLLTLLCGGAMLAGYGLLVRYWNRTSPPKDKYAGKITKTSWSVLTMGIIIIIAATIKRLVNTEWLNTAMFPIGGFMLVVMLYIFCVAVLKNQRRKRSLLLEWPLFAGFFISLIPPSFELLNIIQRQAN